MCGSMPNLHWMPQTPCSVAVRAFASKDHAQMRKLGRFLDDIFERLDGEHTKYGESGIEVYGLTRTLEIVAEDFAPSTRALLSLL